MNDFKKICRDIEFIEIIDVCQNWYFKYAALNFDVKNDFYQIFTTC